MQKPLSGDEIECILPYPSLEATPIFLAGDAGLVHIVGYPNPNEEYIYITNLATAEYDAISEEDFAAHFKITRAAGECVLTDVEFEG